MSEALRKCEQGLAALEAAMVDAVRVAEAAPPAEVDDADAARVDGLRMRQKAARAAEVARQRPAAAAVRAAFVDLDAALSQLTDVDDAELEARLRALEEENATLGRAIVKAYAQAAVQHDVLLARIAAQL